MATPNKNKGGRPRTGVGDLLSVRLHEPLMRALDLEAKRLGRERGGPVSRPEAVRDVLARVLLAKGAK